MTKIKPILVISSCLLGEPVRYDGRSKEYDLLTELKKYNFEFYSICPEYGGGLGVPRETIELVKVGDRIDIMTTDTRVDRTDAIRTFCQREIEHLNNLYPSGFILKARSPSCGIAELPLFNYEKQPIATKFNGIFAHMVMKKFPGTPIASEEDLKNKNNLDLFVKAVYLYHKTFDYV